MVRASTRWLGVVLVAGTAAVVLPGLPAAAGPIERGTFEEPFDAVQEDFCEVTGLDVQVTGVFSGRYVVTTKGGFPFGHRSSRLTRTITNLDTGLSVSDTANVLERDVRVTDNGDGTVTLLVLATGSSTLKDGTGTVIARDPGQTRFELLIDLGGTPQDISDDELIEFLGVTKPSTGRSDDFCVAAVAAIT